MSIKMYIFNVTLVIEKLLSHVSIFFFIYYLQQLCILLLYNPNCSITNVASEIIILIVNVGYFTQIV